MRNGLPGPHPSQRGAHATETVTWHDTRHLTRPFLSAVKLMMRIWQLRSLLTLLILWNLISIGWAGLAPESVLVVVNADSMDSLSIANEYVSLRQIPAVNVVSLNGVTNVEQLSVDDFRRQILGPVLDAIRERGLKSQIRCIAYSADLPTAIHLQGDIGGRTLPQILTPVGSINGLTYLHELTMAGDLRYLDLQVNTYARRTTSRQSDTPWTGDEVKSYADAIRTLGLEARRPRAPSDSNAPADATDPANNPAITQAFTALQQLHQQHPQAAELLYNRACALAVFERTDEALVVLKSAVAAGWFDHRHTQRDPDLRSLQNRDDFKQLLEQMKTVMLDVQPAIGFRSEVSWDRTGSPSSTDPGPRYLLSTVLGITAGRGNTRDEVIRNLQRAASAEGTRPTGTIYYMRNGDVRSTTREWGFASAVEKLKSMGIDAAIENGVLPEKKARIAGAMIGIADFDWPKSDSRILPGAIVEHLTSFGGVMTKGAGQTPLTEFLRHGATGASGTVTEPYALQAKFPSPFIHVHYASGATLAEAFYLSVTGPYQLLIVGDPLCNPWRRDIGVSLRSPEANVAWRDVVTLHPEMKTPDDVKLSFVGLYLDGRLVKTVPPGAPIELATTSWPDGEHRVSLLAWGNDRVESVGRWSSMVTIRNQPANRQPQLKPHAEGEQPFEAPLVLHVTCPEATSISIHHLGRVVAKVEGAAGTATLNTKTIGSGPVTLQAQAKFADGTSTFGPAITLTVKPMSP